MHELDRVMKILAANYPHIFMKLLFHDAPDVKLQAVEDTAINIPEKRSDKVLRIQSNHRDIILSLEFMIRPDRKEIKRFHAKNGILSESFKLPVLTVIIYLERGRYRTFYDRYSVEVNGIRNEIIFHRILLWEYEDKIRSGELRELAPLLILFSSQKDREVIEQEKHLISQIKNQQEQADLLALCAMLAYRKFKDVLIKELFYKEYQMLKQSTFVREWIDEGKKEGKKEGKEEGIKEGLRKGRIELILAQLGRILGRVNSDLEGRIHNLNDQEIKKLSLDLLRIKQLPDLEEWFRSHQKE